MQRKNNIQRQGTIKEVEQLRFTYHPNSQTIKDHNTGERYEGNRKTCRLLNTQHERLHEKDQLLTDVLEVNENLQKIIRDFEKISEKYNIRLEDIPQTFEEYVALDNGEEL